MKIKHIIWDWNGTLFNDTRLCYELTKSQILKLGGSEFTYDQFRKAYQHPVINIYKTLCEEFKEENFDKLAGIWFEDYKNNWKEYNLFEDAESVLNQVLSLGKTQSIVSALNGPVLVEMVEHCAVVDFFTHVDGLHDFSAHSKVDLAQAQFAKLHIEASESLVIGDSLHDLEVAEELGAHCVLVTTGADCPEKLEQSSAPFAHSISEAIEMASQF